MAVGSCGKKFGAIVGLLKAILSRMLFVVHGLICIWRLFVVKQEPLYWCMVLTLLLIILEMIVTLRVKNGAELGWFSPTVFLYLAYTVPPIWLLELDLLKRRIEHRYTKGYLLAKETQNVAYLPGKIRIPFSLDPEKWVRILQQVLLLLLILGRWLLPKGKISREQLSQLLLIYIGMAADIIELFEAFKETAVMYSWDLTIVILSLWTASLLQFTFVVSTARARRPSPVYVEEAGDVTINSDPKATSGQRHDRGENDSREGPARRSCCSPSGRCCCCCCSAESVSILTSITLQDGPFLVLRMLLIFRYNVLSYTNIFFTSKNTLVILLQVYRLAILYCQRLNKKKEKRRREHEERYHKRKGVVVNAEEEMTRCSETDSGQENAKAGLRPSERKGRSERKSNGCCCCCKDKNGEDDFDRYQEEEEEEEEEGEEEGEEEEEIVIDEEYLSEEFSDSEMFEIVTCPSLEDSQLQGSVSSSPSTELSTLNLTQRQQTDRKRRRIGHRAGDGAHSELERRRNLQHNRPIRKDKGGIEWPFKSKAESRCETERLPTALHLQQKNIPRETDQKKKGKMKTEEGGNIEKGGRFMKAYKETIQINHEFEPDRPLNKNSEPSTSKRDPISSTLGKDPKYSTLRKDPKNSTIENYPKYATLGKEPKSSTLKTDPKSKRPKLFEVAVEARKRDRQCREELADGDWLKSDSKETLPLKMTTRCPNCSTPTSTSKTGRQNGHKRRWSPEGVVVSKTKEQRNNDYI